jgi:hypothetical protein
MERTLKYERPDDGGLFIDFDNVPNARYELTLHPENADAGDGIVLTATPEACLAFARLFAQLAEYEGHVHLGYTHEEPQGPGIRIVVRQQD